MDKKAPALRCPFAVAVTAASSGATCACAIRINKRARSYNYIVKVLTVLGATLCQNATLASVATSDELNPVV